MLSDRWMVSFCFSTWTSLPAVAFCDACPDSCGVGRAFHGAHVGGERIACRTLVDFVGAREIDVRQTGPRRAACHEESSSRRTWVVGRRPMMMRGKRHQQQYHWSCTFSFCPTARCCCCLPRSLLSPLVGGRSLASCKNRRRRPFAPFSPPTTRQQKGETARRDGSCITWAWWTVRTERERESDETKKNDNLYTQIYNYHLLFNGQI